MQLPQIFTCHSSWSAGFLILHHPVSGCTLGILSGIPLQRRMNRLFCRSAIALTKLGVHRGGGCVNLTHGCGAGVTCVMQITKRFKHNDDLSDVSVDEQSWVASRLQAQGEALKEVPPGEMMELSDETVHQPSEKVKKLVAEIIQLNVLECQQMLKLMQKRLGIPDEQLYGSMGMGMGGGGMTMQQGAGGIASAADASAAAPEGDYIF